jgi:hypothetical protein
MTNCELNTIIENEIGIFGLLLVSGSTALHFFKRGSFRLCKKGQQIVLLGHPPHPLWDTASLNSEIAFAVVIIIRRESH